jgi:5'-3' exoribonuclease 2
MAMYKKNFRLLGGYLTEDGEVNLKRVQQFIQTIGAQEETIFQKRARIHQVPAKVPLSFLLVANDQVVVQSAF